MVVVDGIGVFLPGIEQHDLKKYSQMKSLTINCKIAFKFLKVFI